MSSRLNGKLNNRETMMKNVIKLSMIAALTMSSASVFAAAGDPVTGGQGTVTVAGTVQSSTCSVAIDKASQTIHIKKSDYDALKNLDAIPGATDKSTFTLSNCNAAPVKVIITPTGGNQIDSSNPFYTVADNTRVAVRIMSNVTSGVTGGKWSNTDGSALSASAQNVNFTMATSVANGFRFTPTADTASFTVDTVMAKLGGIPYDGPSTFTTGYTYNLTYL